MRRIKRRSAEKSIAVIIDGKDEKWYLETIKEHYPNMAMKKATIKPDLPQKKSVLVVALLVVLCRHAVQSRIEVLGSRINGVVGLLEGQGDAATVEIDVNHLDEDFLARLDDGLRVLHVAVGQLGDMHEAFDAVFDGDEDTELNDLGDLALDDLARNVGAGEALPRIFLGGLEGQGDAFTIEINVKHLDGDLEIGRAHV